VLGCSIACSLAGSAPQNAWGLHPASCAAGSALMPVMQNLSSVGIGGPNICRLKILCSTAAGPTASGTPAPEPTVPVLFRGIREAAVPAISGAGLIDCGRQAARSESPYGFHPLAVCGLDLVSISPALACVGRYDSPFVIATSALGLNPSFCLVAVTPLAVLSLGRRLSGILISVRGIFLLAGVSGAHSA
jgi:hypothetical protein